MAKLIVIDGLDGSGKATQTELLKQYLEKEKQYKVYKISFPDYESDSSAPVKMYLNGELGSDPETLNPYMCSTFYAVDRAIQYIKNIKAMMSEGDNVIVLADRYLSANIIHQGAKLKDEFKRHSFYEWDYEFETKLVGIPQEDATIILSVPVEVSQKLMSHRYNNDESKKDIHESNIKYLEDCYFAATDACEYLRSKGYRWEMIKCETCNEQGDPVGIKSIDEIHKEIIQKLKEMSLI